MISLTFLLLALSVAAAAHSDISSQQSESISHIPDGMQIRSNKTDVKHLAIDLRFDMQKKQAYGTAAVTLFPLSSTDRITLDAGMLTVNSVRMDNGTQLKFNYDGGDKNDGLEILLDRIYDSDEELTVVIDYHTNWENKTDPNNLGGSNGKGLRFLVPTSAEPKKRKQIWSMGEPESNRYWFPGYDSPDDLRTSELKATVEKDMTVISNGILTEIKDNADGTHTFHYKMDTPYANHLTTFVAGEYADVKQYYGDKQLHNYCYPEEIEATEASVIRLPDMMKFFSEVTGVNYPYPVYSQIFVQDLPWGMAGITASTQTENMVDDFGTHSDFFYLWDGLEGESLAQQWFGSYLTCSDWNHIWLTKAFGRYLSGLYCEYKNGREEFLLYQHAWDISTYLFDRSSGFIQPVINNNNENVFEFINGNYPYFHGASVLHMLRKHLGDEKWSKAVRLYVSSNSGKTVTTKDLQKAVEETAGESMDWFFEQWLYKTGHPVFTVTKKYDEDKKQLTLVVKQTQKPAKEQLNTEAEFFKGKVEIEIDDRIEKVVIEAKEENVFKFDSPKQPKLINFDFENTWIKEITFEKSIDELLYQLLNDKDITGRQWAMTELVSLARNEKTSDKDKSKIYAGLRNLILGNSYWRLRFNALAQLQSLIAPVTETKPVTLDNETTKMLLTLIDNDRSWVLANAIRFLGMSKDPKYDDIYISAFSDSSDRVVNSAAVALGKCKSPKAFDALIKLKDKPSWKNQSLISTLNGLKELGDPKGYDVSFDALSDLNSPRWTLAVSVWDFRIAAAETIVALGKSNSAYPLIIDRFKKSLDENDLNVIFNNVLLISTLADPRGQEAFELLKIKYKDDANVMTAVDQFESQFKAAVSKQ